MDVRAPVRLRVRDALRDRGLRSEVIDDVMARHRGGQGLPVQDRGPLHADLPGDRLEVPQRARREIVEDRDVIPRAEVLDEMRPDESGAAGHQDARPFHGSRRTEGDRHKGSGDG